MYDSETSIQVRVGDPSPVQQDIVMALVFRAFRSSNMPSFNHPEPDSQQRADCTAQEPLTAKQEVLELLETLLDLFRQHSSSPVGPDLGAVWRAALPPLLAGYGASSGACDRAALRVLLLLDASLATPDVRSGQGESTGEGPAEAVEAAARFSGPLARAGCVELMERSMSGSSC